MKAIGRKPSKNALQVTTEIKKKKTNGEKIRMKEFNR